MRNPRLAPLKDRLTPNQLERRASRMAARSQVASTLHKQMASVALFASEATDVLRRPTFLSRLKWLLFGK